MNSGEIRVGIIGLGKIAQMKYIPTIHKSFKTKIVGLSDKSESLVRKITSYYGYSDECIARSVVELIEKKPQLVFLLTHEHFDIARTLIAAGISVCIEKPICWSLEQVERLHALAKEKKVAIYACYMKRFDPAFEAFRREIKKNDAPLVLNVYCYAGNNKIWCDSLYRIFKETTEEKKNIKLDIKNEWDNFYNNDPSGKKQDRKSSQLLLQLGIHQINLLHALEEELEVESCTAIDDSGVRKIFATLRKDKLVVNYTLVPMFSASWAWREKFEAIYKNRILQYDPGCPFLTFGDSVLRVLAGDNVLENTECRFSYADPFELMIDAVLGSFAIGESSDSRFSIESAKKDIGLIERMLDMHKVIN